MNKGLAIALATGALLGVFAVNNPSDAVPVPAPSLTHQRPQTPVVAQNQQQNKDWDVPKLRTGDPVVKGLKPVEGDDGRPVIQVAILLDTSGSMSTLIDQAKTELWSIVNKLSEAKYKGQSPKIEVALYEYGKSTLQRDEGYIRQLAPFTYDLDGLSEVLFALKTNGGEEYCAWVIRSAMDSLKWKQREGSLRMMFIAGNEPFTQGPVDVAPVLKQADERGILVHPIYCADGTPADKLSWESAADLAHTDLKVIDHTRVAKIPVTPYDQRINELNSELNRTYVAYGSEGSRKVTRQATQDSNMASVSPAAAAERAVTKSSANYQNAEWDVVDKAEAVGGVAKMSPAELPPEMKEMSVAEREAFVAQKAAERKAIQEEIQELNKKRQAFITKEQNKTVGEDATLGQAMVKTVKARAVKEGFSL